MSRQLIITRDGSHTIEHTEMNVTYHSIHGAIQESMHVFIEAGLRYMMSKEQKPEMIHILEMGFGTGLNALLTSIEAKNNQQQIHYTSLEKFPLSQTEASHLNYAKTLEERKAFHLLHSCDWGKDIAIGPYFTLNKKKEDLILFESGLLYNLVYFDAFAPSAQPELWTQEVFEKLYRMMTPEGTLATYCSKGIVRRAMLAAGFTVEKIPGPPGKREMLRASK